MFKKNCKKCGERISNKHSFCEFCGASQKRKEDWGMLGESDIEENFQEPIFRGFNSGILNRMIGSAMKMLEKEMQKEMPKANQQPRTNIKLMINGKEINLDNMKNEKKKLEITRDKLMDNFSKKNLERFSKLPKKEPLTAVKRFSDKIVYEIKLPEIKSMKDVSIVKLENSVEIKAVTKNKAYFKLIPINLPIKDYNLEKGKLILELESKN